VGKGGAAGNEGPGSGGVEADLGILVWSRVRSAGGESDHGEAEGERGEAPGAAVGQAMAVLDSALLLVGLAVGGGRHGPLAVAGAIVRLILEFT
jgi:hypothetical protein